MQPGGIRNVLTALVIVAGGAALAWWQSRDPMAVAIAEITALGPADASAAIEFERALGRATRGTEFEGAWHLNPRSSRKGLNVHLFDSRSPRFAPANALRTLRRNCASLAASTTIVCDIAVVDHLAGQLPRVTPGPDTANPVRASLIGWLVGHELGHIVNGHSGRHHFGGGVEVGVDPGSVDHRQEIEADDFASESLFRDASARVATIRMLIDLVNAEVVKKGIEPQYGAGLLFSYERIVEVTSRCTHPEMTVRAIRMMRSFSRRMGDPALDAMIMPFVRQMQASAASCGPGV